MNLAKTSLPQASENLTPSLRIAQRMRLEQSQLEGVDKRIQVCLSLIYVSNGWSRSYFGGK